MFRTIYAPILTTLVGFALFGAQPSPPSIWAVAVNSGNVLVDNGGAFAAFFGGQSASPKERAVAHIVQIGNRNQPAPSPNDQGAPDQESPLPGATAAPAAGGQRIGMAGFRDEPSGMLVMVDVGSLQAGTYAVSIVDPGVIGGAIVTGTPSATSDVQPSPSLEADVGPTGATGPAIPPGSTPTGQSKANNTQAAQDGAQAGVNKSARGSVTNEIGTLVIDQSGVGRLQQKVETLQVRSVVGQAIVIYAQQGGVPAKPTPLADPKSVETSPVPSNTNERVAVAGGIIQLITDRQPPGLTKPQASQPPANSGATPVAEQPGKAVLPAGPNLIR